MELGKAVDFVLAHPIPIRPMSGDGDVGGSSIDNMVSIGVDSVVRPTEQVACHLESHSKLEIDLVTNEMIIVVD